MYIGDFLIPKQKHYQAHKQWWSLQVSLSTCQVLSSMIIDVCTATTRVSNGKAYSVQDWKRRVRSGTHPKMLVVFFNICWVVHCEFVLHCETVKASTIVTLWGIWGIAFCKMMWTVAHWQLGCPMIMRLCILQCVNYLYCTTETKDFKQVYNNVEIDDLNWCGKLFT